MLHAICCKNEASGSTQTGHKKFLTLYYLTRKQGCPNGEKSIETTSVTDSEKKNKMSINLSYMHPLITISLCGEWTNLHILPVYYLPWLLNGLNCHKGSILMLSQAAWVWSLALAPEMVYLVTRLDRCICCSKRSLISSCQLFLIIVK